MNKPRIYGHLRSIVLAGGEGERVRPLIQRWLGQHKPKQYCAFVGKRSLFQHTLDRALKLTAPEHVVTVIANHHRRVALAQADGRNAGTILLQPENRDTAAGIFLPLTYLWVRDPDATVILYPSDHFVFPEEGFLQVVERAAWAARWLDTHIILLGAAAHSVELEYGWIYPGLDLARSGRHRVRAVSRFIEKPTESQARAAMETGAFWNTLVLATKVETLWKLGWQCLPEMMQLFEELARAIDTSVEAKVLRTIYRRMPSRNLSSDVLQRVPEQTAMIELGDVLWSDWGKPQRIAATLEGIGKQPDFHRHCWQPSRHGGAAYSDLLIPLDSERAVGAARLVRLSGDGKSWAWSTAAPRACLATAGKQVRLPRRPHRTRRWLERAGEEGGLTMNHKHLTALVALTTLCSLFSIAEVSLAPAHAAGWITPAAGEKELAPWVKKIEDEWAKNEYRGAFSNDPRAPMAAMLHLLNQAAQALDQKNEALAKDYVARAIGKLEAGVRRGYYSRREIQPIKDVVFSQFPIKMGSS